MSNKAPFSMCTFAHSPVNASGGAAAHKPGHQPAPAAWRGCARLEARVLAPQQHARVRAQALEVGRVGGVAAHQQHRRHLRARAPSHFARALAPGHLRTCPFRLEKGLVAAAVCCPARSRPGACARARLKEDLCRQLCACPRACARAMRRRAAGRRMLGRCWGAGSAPRASPLSLFWHACSTVQDGQVAGTPIVKQTTQNVCGMQVPPHCEAGALWHAGARAHAVVLDLIDGAVHKAPLDGGLVVRVEQHVVARPRVGQKQPIHLQAQRHSWTSPQQLSPCSHT